MPAFIGGEVSATVESPVMSSAASIAVNLVGSNYYAIFRCGLGKNKRPSRILALSL